MLSLALALTLAVSPTLAPERDHAPDRLIVRLKAGEAPASLHARHTLLSVESVLAGTALPVSRPQRQSRAAEEGDERARTLYEGLQRTFVLRFAPGTDILAALGAYRRDPAVERVELDLVFTTHWMPNDPFLHTSGSWEQTYQDLYGLHRTQAPAAWDESLGSGVTVAVVDSGLDYNHEDIRENVWANPGEIAGNGIDDDANGYVDDVRGWDFAGGDGDPRDGYGHGTLMAGIIAATGNNGLGIIGMAPRARIMPLRCFDDQGYAYISDLAAAIVYATDNGADVVNAALGGPGPAPVFVDAVHYAIGRGVVVVGSAAHGNIDVGQWLPASIPEVITVAASDPDDRKASFTNWGPSVDVTAPGVEVLSLRAAGTGNNEPKRIVKTYYYRRSGTSLSCAYVAGAAALVLFRSPSASVEEVRDQLVFTADNLDALNPGWEGKLGGGRLNVRRALTETLGPPVHSIRGTVVNRDGQPLPGALVWLGEMGSRVAKAGTDGSYAFTGLRPGNYTVTASLPGYELRPAFRAFRPLAGAESVQNFVGIQRWDVQTVDSSPWAGWNSAVTVDAQDRPHILYYHGVTRELLYTTWDGLAWRTERVAPAGWIGNQPSIVLDVQGQPHIAYAWLESLEGTTQLRYARRTAGTWAVQTVDDAHVIYTGQMVLDAAGRPHISYCDNSTYDLKYATWDGSAWHRETLDSWGTIGAYSSLRLDAQGRVHIAYSDGPIDGNPVDGLKYAVQDGNGGWRISVVDSNNGIHGGSNIDMVLDAAGRPRIVYSGNTPPNLKYASWNGSAWVLETVRSGAYVGFGASLALDGDGRPHILYHSPGEALQHARRIEGEWGPYWKVSPLHAGNVGFHNDMVSGSRGRLHASYFDREMTWLKYARSVDLTEPRPVPPRVWIHSPGDGSVVSGAVPVAVAASSEYGITHVELFVDGVSVGADSVSPYAWTWDTTAYTSGSHTLTARAFDGRGVGVDATVAVEVANGVLEEPLEPIEPSEPSEPLSKE